MISIAASVVSLPRIVKAEEHAELQVINWPATRQITGNGWMIDDIESHLWSGHPYRSSDKVNWVHEGIQGIAGSIRGKFGGWDECNACYLLGNKAVVLNEPRVSLQVVKRTIPRSLMGDSVDYLNMGAWQYNTMFLLDELNAYTTGSWAGFVYGGNEGYSLYKTVQFTVYAIYAMQASENTPRQTAKDHQQLRAFIAWNWNIRVWTMVKRSQGTRMEHPSTDAYLARAKPFIENNLGNG